MHNAFKLGKQMQRYTATEKITRANKIYKGLRADPQFLTARIVRSPKFLLTAHRSPTNLTVPCRSEADGNSHYATGSSISCGCCLCACQGSHPAHWPGLAAVRFSSAQSALLGPCSLSKKPRKIHASFCHTGTTA